MKITKLTLALVLWGSLFFPAEASGASCPYCGRAYGEPAPGDEMRVYGLRRAHEANCPAGKDPTWGRVSSYGAVTIYNLNNTEINFQIRSGQGEGWSKATIKANGSYYRWHALPASFQIRFDASFASGHQGTTYDLEHNVIRGRKPTWNEGRKYEFSIVGEQIDMNTASEKTTQAYTSYGVVTIVNTSEGPINYQIQYRKNGAWSDTTTVKAQSSYYHWVEEPAKFRIRFDRSTKKGYQRKMENLKHNTLKGRKPTASDGRRYELKLDGEKIKLAKVPVDRHVLGMMATAGATDGDSKDTLLTAADVSVVGRGSGQTRKGDFGEATRAKGTVTLTYMPRINGVIPTVDGSWKAKMIEDQTSDANSLYKTQVWLFESKEFGEARAIITGSAAGASGTATGWEAPVPGNPKADKFEISFGVEFAGENMFLKNFSKAY